MLTIEAAWDNTFRRFKYKLPGVGWAVMERRGTSPVSHTAVLVREVKSLASILRVKLPAEWELLVRR